MKSTPPPGVTEAEEKTPDEPFRQHHHEHQNNILILLLALVELKSHNQPKFPFETNLFATRLSRAAVLIYAIITTMEYAIGAWWYAFCHVYTFFSYRQNNMFGDFDCMSFLAHFILIFQVTLQLEEDWKFVSIVEGSLVCQRDQWESSWWGILVIEGYKQSLIVHSWIWNRIIISLFSVFSLLLPSLLSFSL